MNLFKKRMTFEEVKTLAYKRYDAWRGQPKDALERLNQSAYVSGYCERYSDELNGRDR